MELVDKLATLIPGDAKAHILEAYYRTLPYRLAQWLHRKSVEDRYRFLSAVPRGDIESGCLFIHIPRTAGSSVGRGLFPEKKIEASHTRAWDFRLILDEERYDALFKFAFVRNPWDRVLSSFRYLRKGGWGANDEQWAADHDLSRYSDVNSFVTDRLRRGILHTHPHWIPQHYWVTDPTGTNIEVDFIGRFETLTRDFEELCSLLNKNAGLPHANQSDRESPSYRLYFNDEAAGIVSEVYQQDIEMFGYQF